RGALVPEDQFVLAVLYDQEGDTREADRRLRNLVEQDKRPRYIAHYAMTLLARHRDPEEAEKKVADLEKLERDHDVGPNGYGSVDLRARLLEAKDRGKDALELLEAHVSRKDAQPGEVLLLLGSLSRQKLYRRAFTLCEKTWDEGKCSPEAMGAVSVGLLAVMKPTASASQARTLE